MGCVAQKYVSVCRTRRLYCRQMFALLVNDTAYLHCISQLGHFETVQRVPPLVLLRPQAVFGVGTSRSALLLTVRVESGIARTKSNNGPRSWLCSFSSVLRPDTLLQNTKLHCVHTYTHAAHLPASVEGCLWPPTVAWLAGVGVAGV